MKLKDLKIKKEVKEGLDTITPEDVEEQHKKAEKAREDAEKANMPKDVDSTEATPDVKEQDKDDTVSVTESVKNRAELKALLEKLGNLSKKPRVSRSVKEGYRYDVTYIKESIKLTDEDVAQVLYIRADNDGYSPSQCGHTMTVRELCDYLENNFGENLPVYMSFDRGYTYGGVTEDTFYEAKFTGNAVEECINEDKEINGKDAETFELPHEDYTKVEDLIRINDELDKKAQEGKLLGLRMNKEYLQFAEPEINGIWTVYLDKDGHITRITLF